MRKKAIFLMLTLWILSAAGVNAQVRIGGDADPNESAVLDLNATNAANNSKLGLALPRVTLTSTVSFAPLKAHVAGMMVYNTGTVGDVTPGTYYNDGTKWIRVGSGALTVETDGGLTIISPMAGNESYTFGISTGGVTASKIADNAVITAKIANNAVTMAKIADGAVTAAKLNAMSASSGQVLKYNGTAWAPATDAGLTSEVDGIIGNEVTNATDNGGLTRSGSGTATTPYTLGIANNGVTAARIASDAVTTVKILNANVTTDKIADAAVTSVKIADGTIATADLANSAVTLDKLASNSVNSAKIVDSSIATADLADGAVTAAKLNAMSASSGQVLKYNGTAWAPATDAGLTSEVDGIIGNEVTNATDNGGLTRSGSGTTVAPYTLGIANNGVTAARIASDAVTTVKILNANVTTDKIADAAVTSVKIADGTIATADLANSAVTLDKLASNSVNSAKIVDSSIATADLANGAVTAAKLNAMGAAANQALIYNGSAWAPTTLSMTALSGGSYGYDVPSVASTGCDGSVLYIGAFNYASGTSGDVAKGVTNASNTADHATLPTFSSYASGDYTHNSGYYLCVYKKDGNGGSTTTWANAVNNCANGTYADGSTSAGWYLPNFRELRVLYENLKNGTSFFTLEKYGTIISYTDAMASNAYWSSTERSAAEAWDFGFGSGYPGYNTKPNGNGFVRCVKRISAI